MNIHSANGRVLAFERRFEAPRDVVYSLWTHPRHLIRWFGPRGRGLSHCDVDLRVGGKWRVCISMEDENVWVSGTYKEIAVPRRLVFSYSMDLYRYETLVTIDFEDLGAATLMKFHQAEFISEPDFLDHGWGWTSALDRFSEYLLRLNGAGLLRHDLYDPNRRDGLAEDYAEAAARAKKEREAGGSLMPPSAR